MAAVSAVLSALGTLLFWMLCAVGILLGIVLFLLLIVLFVPAFAEVRYDDDEWFVVVGMACVRVHVYPYFYFIWDRYANESEEEREAQAKKFSLTALRTKARTWQIPLLAIKLSARVSMC